MTSKLLGCAIATLVWQAAAAGAEGPFTVHWDEICRVAENRQLSITTREGRIIEGRCVSVAADQIDLAAKEHRVITIARPNLARIRLVRDRYAKRHALASLGKGMREGFRTGVQWLLSPAAPLGLVVIPGTAAWGVVAAPFCLLGELVRTRSVEIQELTVL